MLKSELLGHWAVTLQGVLLSWTKHFKVRGVQDTDVVSSLRKALQKHKASFVPAGGYLQIRVALDCPPGRSALGVWVVLGVVRQPSRTTWLYI